MTKEESLARFGGPNRVSGRGVAGGVPSRMQSCATNGLPEGNGLRFKEAQPVGLNAQGQLLRIEAGWPGSLSEPTRTSLSPLRRRIVMSLSKKLPA